MRIASMAFVMFLAACSSVPADPILPSQSPGEGDVQGVERRHVAELLDAALVTVPHTFEVNVVKLAVAAEYLMGLHEYEMYFALRNYVDVHSDDYSDESFIANRYFIALLAARLVYVPMAGEDVELPALLPWPWLIQVSHAMHVQGFPLFPVAEQNGVPFVLWRPGNGGVAGDVRVYLEYCRNYCRKRSLLPPLDRVNAAAAAENLLERVEAALAATGLRDVGLDFGVVRKDVWSQAIMAEAAE